MKEGTTRLPLSLLFSGPNKLRGLNYSSHLLPSLIAVRPSSSAQDVAELGRADWDNPNNPFPLPVALLALEHPRPWLAHRAALLGQHSGTARIRYQPSWLLSKM